MTILSCTLRNKRATPSHRFKTHVCSLFKISCSASPQVILQDILTFTTRPLRRPFSMQAGKFYPFFAMFVEGSVADVLTLKWRIPGSSSDVAIPSSVFCTGWSNFNNGILQVYSPFAMLPGTEVAFSIQALPNPFCPRPSNSQISSAFFVPQIALMNSVSSSVQTTSSGTFSDNSCGCTPASLLAMSLGAIDKSKVLNIKLVSPVTLPSTAIFIITLSGTGFIFAGNSVVFASPAAAAATANVSTSPLVLVVKAQHVQQFLANSPIIFSFGNLTFAPPSTGMSGIFSSVVDSDGRCIASSSNGVISPVPRMRWVFMCGSAANGWTCE
jgi:hypothetical protein